MASRPTIAELVATRAPVALPGVWDALSARLAADAGFDVVFLSGYALSATRLAEPDFGLIGAADVLDAAARIVAAVSVPVIVDIDTGYGNAFNVERVVRDLVRLGVAGAFLEDQLWPKRCGHMRGKDVVPLDDYLPKLRAALAAAHGSGFHVTARTDARAPLGLDEAIRRARAFADAGADAVFVEAPESVEEMDRIRRELPAHVALVANMVERGRTPVRTLRALGDAGYALVAFPLTGLFTATRALRDAYATLRRDGASAALAGAMVDFDAMNALLGLDERYRREVAWKSR